MENERNEKLDHIAGLITRGPLEAWHKYDATVRLTASVLLKRLNKDNIMASFHNKDSVTDSAKKNSVSKSTVYRKINKRRKK